MVMSSNNQINNNNNSITNNQQQQSSNVETTTTPATAAATTPKTITATSLAEILGKLTNCLPIVATTTADPNVVQPELKEKPNLLLEANANTSNNNIEILNDVAQVRMEPRKTTSYTCFKIYIRFYGCI